MAQTLQLGISGAEVTLPGASRSFTVSGNELISSEGRAADGTLHVDFVSNKLNFTITYGVISEANKDIITGIYTSQISNGSFLNFIYTNESGATVSQTVKMEAPTFGSIVPNKLYYYNGCTIQLQGV